MPNYRRFLSIEKNKNRAIVKDQKTEFEFEVLSLFNSEEQALYKSKFVEAGKITGEVK